MTDRDIASIEAALDCKLPSGYRKFLLNRTTEVEELKEQLPLRLVLWTDAEEIIAENKSVRERPHDLPIGPKKTPWPKYYFIVTSNGAADYWFIDLSRELGGIWSYQHEAQDIEPHYDNFGEWLGDLRKDAQRPEDWQ